MRLKVLCHLLNLLRDLRLWKRRALLQKDFEKVLLARLPVECFKLASVGSLGQVVI